MKCTVILLWPDFTTQSIEIQPTSAMVSVSGEDDDQSVTMELSGPCRAELRSPEDQDEPREVQVMRGLDSLDLRAGRYLLMMAKDLQVTAKRRAQWGGALAVAMALTGVFWPESLAAYRPAIRSAQVVAVGWIAFWTGGYFLLAKALDIHSRVRKALSDADNRASREGPGTRKDDPEDGET